MDSQLASVLISRLGRAARGTHLADAGAGERRALLGALGGRGRAVVYLALFLNFWSGERRLLGEFLTL